MFYEKANSPTYLHQGVGSVFALEHVLITQHVQLHLISTPVNPTLKGVTKFHTINIYYALLLVYFLNVGLTGVGFS